MQPVLYKYLALYKKLDMPGIGNLTVEETPATVQFTDKQLQPPASHIRFSPVVHPANNHFYHFLSREWNVEKVIAIRRYKDEIEGMMEQLKTVGMCELSGIGILRKTSEGTIAFAATDALLPLYTILPAERVRRKRARHTVLVGEQEQVKDYVMPEEREEETIAEEEQPKERWQLFALILAIIALLMIGYYYAVK